MDATKTALQSILSSKRTNTIFLANVWTIITHHLIARVQARVGDGIPRKLGMLTLANNSGTVCEDVVGGSPKEDGVLLGWMVAESCF